jgi:hypothetical protein
LIIVLLKIALLNYEGRVYFGVQKTNKKKINISTHALLRYDQRFAKSSQKLTEIANDCRKDLVNSYTFKESFIKPYLREVNKNTHTGKIIKQEFSKCHIYESKVFVEKDNNIVTILSVSQLIKKEYIPFLNTFVENFEIKPDLAGVI